VSGGSLWPDKANKLFYLFGGEYNEDVTKFSNLWFFDVIYNTWNKSLPDGSQLDINWPVDGASAVTDEGVAYYYGGYLTNKSVFNWNTDPLMLNSLVTFDTKTQKWNNRTYDPVPIAEGNMHYIPASERGMLIYIGGVELKNNIKDYVSFSKSVRMVPVADSLR
jgi:hypothetical protein